MARLRVTGARAGLELPLHGTAIAPGELTADTSSLDFGQVEVDLPRQLDVLVSNPGSADLTLSPRTATAGFAIADNCPATLTPGRCAGTPGDGLGCSRVPAASRCVL